MITIRDLAEQIVELKAKAGKEAKFLWGTAGENNTVVLDGETEPIEEVTFFMPAAPTDRVLVLLQARQATVIARALQVNDIKAETEKLEQAVEDLEVLDDLFSDQQIYVGEIAAEAEAAKDRAVEALEKAFEAQGGVQAALDSIGDLEAELTGRLADAESDAFNAATDAAGALLAAARAVVSTETEYALSESRTTAPTGGWSTSSPSPTTALPFVWLRTVVTYGNGDTVTTSPAVTTGPEGVSVESVTPYYRKLASSASAPDIPTTMTPSGWTATEPDWAKDFVLYRIERVVLSNGSFQYTPVTKVEAWSAADKVQEDLDNLQIGGRNYFRDSAGPFTTPAREFVVLEFNMSPVFDKYGIAQEYTISFDLSSKDPSVSSTIASYPYPAVLPVNKYRFPSIPWHGITTEPQRKAFTFKPAVSDLTMPMTRIVFYGTYGTGNVPIVENIKLELGNKATDWTPAPEDIDTEIETVKDSALYESRVEYAVNTSETVAPTSGWSISQPTRAPGSFIWVRTVVTYGSGSTSTTAAALLTGNTGAKGDKGDEGPRGLQGIQGAKGDQGIAGAKGADGLTAYTHIAYADTAAGGGFSQSPAGKAYVGMYVDHTEADSSTPSKYKWSLIKGADGEQGIPGTKGADGQTPYFHTAWATNATGTAGFSTTVSAGKTYLGTYTDYTQADSTDPSKYSWSLIKGADGAKGDKGDKGDTGDDGVAGKDGVGLTSTTISYAKSTSGTVTPTSGWQAQPPAPTKGQYLWTRTVWAYTDSTTETGYSTAYWATDGAPGTDGIAGKDGVGITSTTITYAQSTSGTTAPTTGWQSTPPTAVAGRYVWTRTVWAYTDNTSETGYAVGKIGDTGTKGDKGDTGNKGDTGSQGVSVTGVARFYAQVASGGAAPGTPAANTVPTAPWVTAEPGYVANTDLYTTDQFTYSNGNRTYTTAAKSSGYTAAGEAATLAANLRTFVESGLMRIAKESEPPAPGKGLMWGVLAEAGTQIIGLKLANLAGTAWQPYQLLAEDVLVVGPNGIVRLKDGVVGAAQVKAEEVAAALGEFIRVKTGQITWDNAAGNLAFITRMLSDEAYLRLVYTNQLIVDGYNYAPGPGGYQSVYDLGADTSFSASANDPTGWALRIDPRGATIASRSAYGPQLPVTPGSSIFVGVNKTYSNAGDNARFQLRFFFYDSAGEQVDNPMVYDSGPGDAPALLRIEETVEVPATAVTGRIRFYVYAVDTPREVWFRNFTVRAQTSAVLIENGAVLAEKLAAQIVLASEIIAGDPSGTHAKMDSTGLSVFRAQPEGNPSQVISLGVTGSKDFLTIADTSGSALASIDDEGGISGTVITSDAEMEAESFMLSGAEPDTWVSEMVMRPVVTAPIQVSEWGLSSDTYFKGDVERRILEFNWENEDTESHTVWIPDTTFTLNALGGGSVILRWRGTLNGVRPTTSSGVYATARQSTAATGYETISLPSASMTVPAGATLRVVLTGIQSNGYGYRFPYAVRLRAYDLGRTVEQEGDWRTFSVALEKDTGTSTPPTTVTPPPANDTPKPKRYVRTWKTDWAGSYPHSGGSRNTYYGDKAAQGSYTGGSGARHRGLVGFNQDKRNAIISALTGATITKIEAYVYFEHWWNNSGGTAGIGVHGNLGRPASDSTLSRLVTKKTKKPGGAWVTLPSSVHAGFKSGANRGLVLQSSDSGTSQYGICRYAKLRFTYTK